MHEAFPPPIFLNFLTLLPTPITRLQKFRCRLSINQLYVREREGQSAGRLCRKIENLAFAFCGKRKGERFRGMWIKGKTLWQFELTVCFSCRPLWTGTGGPVPELHQRPQTIQIRHQCPVRGKQTAGVGMVAPATSHIAFDFSWYLRVSHL